MKITVLIILNLIFFTVFGQLGLKSELSVDTNSFIISPNPFVDSTNIQFELTGNDTVTLMICDKWGNLDSVYFENTILAMGQHAFIYSTQISNMYIVYLKVNEITLSKLVIRVDSLNSIKTQPKDEFFLKPNPAKDYFIIEFKDSKEREIKIINQFGQVIISEINNGNKQIKIKTDNFARGIYFVSIANENSITTRKLLIE